MRIVVLGSNGQLGKEFQYLAKDNRDFVFFSREEADITYEEDLIDIFESLKPDYVINCAAYTLVDQAERSKDLNHKINAVAVGMLAELCKKYGAFLIHYSSDYVYHSLTSKALAEEDRTAPKGEYAKSKLIGEENIAIKTDQFIILRTSWVYSVYGGNFVKTMLQLGKQKSELTIVSDQIGSPTYAADLAQVTLDILNKLEKQPSEKVKFSGIYNYSNEGHTSWDQFAAEIFSQRNIDCKIIKTTTREYDAPAPRPPWSVLSKEKIVNTFGVKLKDWKVALKECLERLESNN